MPYPMNPRTLDATYRARAIPLGSVRHLSWLFAAPAARDPLLGVFALQAEWNALTDPRTERSAAQIKLAWWQDEMRRLSNAAPVHPISHYLAALPGADGEHFAPLIGAIDAASLEVTGVPLERGRDLAPHAQRLRANPLLVVAAMSERGADVHACTGALAVGEYLARALEHYRAEARAGRVPFAVDELLAAGIDNADLASGPTGAALNSYLATLRQRAAQYFAQAAASLAPRERRGQRHLLILAALGAYRLQHSSPHALRSVYLAWATARQAALSRDK